MLGVAQPTYWQWETGSIPKIEQGLVIARVTGGEVPIDCWSLVAAETESAT